MDKERKPKNSSPDTGSFHSPTRVACGLIIWTAPTRDEQTWLIYASIKTVVPQQRAILEGVERLARTTSGAAFRLLAGWCRLKLRVDLESSSSLSWPSSASLIPIIIVINITKTTTSTSGNLSLVVSCEVGRAKLGVRRDAAFVGLRHHLSNAYYCANQGTGKLVDHFDPSC